MATLLVNRKPSLLKAAFRLFIANARAKPSQSVSARLTLALTAVSRSRFILSKFGIRSSLGLIVVAAAAKKGNMVDITDIIDTADNIYNGNKFQDVYDHLISYKDSDSAEILWRLARAAVDIGKLSNDKEFRKEKIYEAMEIIERAMKLDSSNAYVHKWYAFTVKYMGEYEGNKKQIQNAYKIKEHLEKAGELDPKDATIQYALGSWAFTFAEMGWMTRKLAETVFDKPPTATYEDALKYFERAEEMDPNFYSMNLLMIGKVYIALGKKEKAIEFLKRARDYSPNVSADDQEANTEAVKLLDKLGVKN